MVRIELKYLGNLKVEATHGPSGATLITAAPVDNQGDGSSFSPTDLTATSLGAGMTTIMGILAKRHDWDLSELTATVDKEMIATPYRRIGKLTVNINYPKAIEEKNAQLLQRAALTCPVAFSLNSDIEIVTIFNWNGTIKEYSGNKIS